MPLWKIYHPAGAYSQQDKQDIANKITDVYARSMPRFYVNVMFKELETGGLYIGGKPHDNFVRVTIAHIARAIPDAPSMRYFVNIANKVIAPFVAERGYDWELHIDETPFDLWSIQGHFPPREGTADEKRWIEENQPSTRTHD